MMMATMKMPIRVTTSMSTRNLMPASAPNVPGSKVRVRASQKASPNETPSSLGPMLQIQLTSAIRSSRARVRTPSQIRMSEMPRVRALSKRYRTRWTSEKRAVARLSVGMKYPRCLR